MLTREEIIRSFAEIDARVAAEKAAARPKPAAVKAKERWAEKPTEVVIRDAAAQNAEVAERLRREREMADAEARRARYQAELDLHWQSMLDAQREHRSFRMVAGFWEGPHPGDYNPVARYEREWRR